jgi:hypothetical protein
MKAICREFPFACLTIGLAVTANMFVAVRVWS